MRWLHVGLVFVIGCAGERPSEPKRPPAPPPPLPAAAVASAPAAPPAVLDAAVACPNDVDGGVVDVRLEKQGTALFLSAPAIGLHFKVLDILTPGPPHYCHAQPMNGAQRTSFGCSYGGLGGTDYTVEVERGRLVFAESQAPEPGFDGWVKSFHEPVLLPCNVRVVHHPFKLRDPKWSRFGSACASRCIDIEEDCMDPCWMSMTDEKGELTEEGSRCRAKCDAATTKCRSRCSP